MAHIRDKYTVLLCGGPRVGKTWFAKRYCSGHVTSGFEGPYYSKNVNINGHICQLVILETSCLDEGAFGRTAGTAVPDAIILMYNITDESSFLYLENYVNRIKEHRTPRLGMTLLVGSMVDLAHTSRRVRRVLPQMLSKKPCLLFYEVSSLTNHRISDVFQAIINKIASEMPPQLGIARPLTELTFTVTIIGPPGVGKTSLALQYSGDSAYVRKATVVPDIIRKTSAVDGHIVELELWDTAGQEKFQALTPSVLRKANAVVLMYSLVDRATFRQLDYFLNQVAEVAPSNLMVTAVVGNMLDKEEERCVQRREGAVYAQKHGFLFLEVSCVTTHGVNDLFEEIIRWLLCSQPFRRPSVGNAIELQDEPEPRGQEKKKRARC
ncbi:GTP-binding protein RHO4 [Ixodes scapularis]|uniref:GTP-binding protein RHO4 n=1 Tax=Ixodes scapularis TaxID=6945 RepID=UPI001C391F4F|nr:GTP-binding protein RHO4 [Ixodes scapularis]